MNSLDAFKKSIQEADVEAGETARVTQDLQQMSCQTPLRCSKQLQRKMLQI